LVFILSHYWCDMHSATIGVVGSTTFVLGEGGAKAFQNSQHTSIHPYALYSARPSRQLGAT
jgi:hypothetical protein